MDKAIFHLLKHGVRGSFSSNSLVFCQSFHHRLVVLVDLEKQQMVRCFKREDLGTSLVVQWLRIFHCRGYSSIPGQGTKIPHAMGQIKPMSDSEEPAQLKKKEKEDLLSYFIFQLLTIKDQSYLPWVPETEPLPEPLFLKTSKKLTDASALDAMVGIPSDEESFP